MYSLCCRFLFEENNRQENANSDQEHRSSGRRHVLEYGLQDGEADRAGYMYYTYYIYYINQTYYAY